MSDPTSLPVPPPNFLFLVESILMQAQMQLGLLQFPEMEGADEEPDLLMARHSIDLLAMLQDKTKGNLTMEEQRLLENGLTELRFRYMQVAEQLGSKVAGAAPSGIIAPSEPAEEEDRPRIISTGGGKGSKTQ